MAERFGRPVTPSGTGFYYRETDLSGLRILLYQDVSIADQDLEIHIRGGGASLCRIACSDGLPVESMLEKHQDIYEFDIVIVYTSDPRPIADMLASCDLPFIIFTNRPERCLAWYPAALCVHTEDGPEALASSILLQMAVRKAELDIMPAETPVIDWIPRLRAMARFLVKDHSVADDILARAMTEAIDYVDDLASDSEVGALLVMLIERIWHREKMSRLT